jgi:hypothetical protein
MHTICSRVKLIIGIRLLLVTCRTYKTSSFLPSSSDTHPTLGSSSSQTNIFNLASDSLRKMQTFTTILALALSTALATAQDIKAFDISAGQGADFMSCMAGQGYQKAVIRGYQQACGKGGRVDPNLLPSYTAAKAAGLRVDSYLFPCVSTQPTGVACKAIETQIDEFVSFIGEHDMDIDTLWFDIEPTTGVCNAWTEGAARNEATAKQWVAALKGTGLKWGIYANGNQWTSMFASRDTDVASDLPLWAVQFDKKPGVESVHTFMGGWTSSVGKQYWLGTRDSVCGGSLDLDSFTA